MDSVDILWTNTPQLIDDPFILGMNVIKSGFLSLIKLIKANDKIKMKSVAQDKTKEIRYSKYSDFNDDIIKNYLKKRII